MGDAADDAYDAAMRDAEDKAILSDLCPLDGKQCDWEVDDDGIWLCLVCGERVDL